MRQATYELLEDGTYYSGIPNFQGVWANEAALEACREELQSVLEDWILVRVAEHLPSQIVDSSKLSTTRSCLEVLTRKIGSKA